MKAGEPVVHHHGQEVPAVAHDAVLALPEQETGGLGRGEHDDNHLRLVC